MVNDGLEDENQINEDNSSNEESVLQIGSAIPNMDPLKINKRIESTNKKSAKKSKLPFISSPVSVTNKREKQYKKNLEGTYGKNYNNDFDGSIDYGSKKNQKPQNKKEVKEMNEYIKELNFKNSHSIPNSYLF